MRTIFSSLLSLGLALLAASPAPGAEYVDPSYGFSVSVPDLGKAEHATPVVQRLMVFGPAEAGFAPNCNVQIQHVDVDLDEYVELTNQQVGSLGLTVEGSEAVKVSGLDGHRFRYSGPMSGHQLTFLALAVERQKTVWLLTCTARTEGFSEIQAEFEEVLDSFSVLPAAMTHN